MKAIIPSSPWLGAICRSCRHRLSPTSVSPSLQSSRGLFFATNPRFHFDGVAEDLQAQLNDLSKLGTSSQQDVPAGETTSGKDPSLRYRPPPPPHHLHIYATKHNCHLTLTNGRRDAIISVSAGNLRFKKSARGGYDAAYQLGIWFMGRIKAMGLLSDTCPDPKKGPIKALEVVFRDFGQGREALTKILLGAEGMALRSRVIRVMDGTRLKFGGTRSPKPRRLG